MTAAANVLSVSEWTIGAGTTAEAIERVARAGYPAIELAATASLDVRDVGDRLAAHGLKVSSLCGMNDPDRDCADESQRLRRRAGDYLRASLEQAAALGAAALVVVPSFRVQKDPPEREGELARAAQTIAGAAQASGPGGPLIALEALNRYETHLVRTLAQAEELRGRIDLPNVGLMADVFHMNIEEDSVPEALRASAEHIVHVHLADSQRREPGTGHLDFPAVFGALADGSYTGALAMEFLPATDAAMQAGREWVQARLAVTAPRILPR